MENKEYPRLYPYSFSEAKRLGELKDWRESHKENIACKTAIEDAIRNGFDGMHLDGDCAEKVIEQFGYRHTAYVLANSLQQKDYDGRFSRGNHDWAQRTYIPPDQTHNTDFLVDSHPAVLDGFVNQYRRAYAALGMFVYTHCLPDTEKQDFEGKVIVLSPNTLKESCYAPENQLWLCTGGFGSHAGSSDRAVYATCLGDGEQTRWNRTDFIGVLADSQLPDWAAKKLAELNGQEPRLGGMEMG